MKSKYLLLIFLLLPLISAQTSLTPVTINQCSNILQTISNATACQLTLYYPNQSVGLDNVTMTKIGDIYNYSFCSNIVSGTYIYVTQCNPNDVWSDPIPVDYPVNGYGSEVTGSQIAGYAILLTLSLLILALTVYGSFSIPWNNNRDEEGRVISINDLKYLRVVGLVFAYLELLLIISIAKNMALGFLLNDGIYNLFNIIYTFMMVGMLVFFPLLIFFTIVIWLNDKTTQKAIARGIEQW